MKSLIEKEYLLYLDILNAYKNQQKALDSNNIEKIKQCTDKLQSLYYQLYDIQAEIKFHLKRFNFKSVLDYISSIKDIYLREKIDKINQVIKEIKNIHLYNTNIIKFNLDKIDLFLNNLKTKQNTYNPFLNKRNRSNTILLFSKKV